MGLMDILSNPDFRAGAMMMGAGGPSTQPVNFGQRMAGLIGQLDAAKAAEEDRKARQAQQQAQLALLGAQLNETNAQAQQRQAQAADLQRKAEEAARVQGVIQQAFSPTTGTQANAASGITGPRPEALSTVGQRAPIDYQGLIAQGVPPELVQKLAESRNYGRDKVARTVEGRDAQGRPVTFQQDEFGNTVGAPIQQWKAPERIDTGGKVNIWDPVSLRTLTTLDKTQTPDSIASNGLGWARLNWDKAEKQKAEAAGQLVESGTGYVRVGKDNIARPVLDGQGEQLKGKGHQLTEAQSNAVSFAMRAQNALDNLATVPSISAYDYASSRVPLAGNFMMSPQGQAAANSEKQFIAAVLRKESGAAISTGEYQTYGDQFFPRPGDSKDTLAQKARNRSVAIQGLMAQAGPGAAQVAPGLAAAGPRPASHNPSDFKILGQE